MPLLFRELIIFAAVDGLILQPLHHGTSPRPGSAPNDTSALRIDYKSNRVSWISSAAAADEGDQSSGLEVYGLVGKPASSALPSLPLLDIYSTVQY